MSLVATRYAEGLFALALEKNCLKEYKENLDIVKKVFGDVDNIKEFFASEKVTKSEKKNVIKESLSDYLTKDVINFLYLLVDKKRITHYNEIIDAYKHLVNDELNIKEGVIESVRPLDDKQIKELEEVLSKDGSQVELKQKINKALISGFKITLENEVIDASMKEKIDKMHNLLSRKEG